MTLRNSIPWFIDLGATDHITSMSSLFFTYFTCSGRKKFKIVNESFSSIAGKCSITISKHLVLNSMLHVPQLACNLLSINKLTKDLNCVAKFFPTHCEFHDLCTRKKIGNVEKVDRLLLQGGLRCFRMFIPI